MTTAEGRHNACKLQRWPTGTDAARCSVADLADLFAAPVDDPTRPSCVSILRPGFRHFGGNLSFRGRVTTIRCNDSNPLVRKTLNEDGTGRVLVIDGGGSMRCALMGDALAKHAFKQGWNGIVVNGCVRDVRDLRSFPIGIMALDSHPLKPGKADPGQRNLPVTVGGVTIKPGDWLYADEDGVMISSEELIIPSDAPRTPLPLTIPAADHDHSGAANGVASSLSNGGSGGLRPGSMGSSGSMLLSRFAAFANRAVTSSREASIEEDDAS